MPNNVVLDTFAGAGQLLSHIGETGAIWSVAPAPVWPYGNAQAPSNTALDGAGSLVQLASVSPPFFPSGGVGLNDVDQAIEVEFTYNNTASLDIGFLAGGDEQSLYLVRLTTYQSGSTQADVYKVSATGVKTYITGFFTATVENIPHVLRIEITPTTKTLKLDGVVQASFSDGAFASGYPVLQLYSSDPWDVGTHDYGFYLNRFQVWGEVTPGQFWTGFFGQREEI